MSSSCQDPLACCKKTNRSKGFMFESKRGAEEVIGAGGGCIILSCCMKDGEAEKENGDEPNGAEGGGRAAKLSASEAIDFFSFLDAISFLGFISISSSLSDSPKELRR